MKKKRLFLLLLFLILPSYAEISYDTLNISRPPAMRFGTGDTPEVKYEINKFQTDTNNNSINPNENKKENKDEVTAKTVDVQSLSDLSFKDLNVKYLSNEISSEMQSDSPYLLSDLAILYDSALKRSETIKYAIYKLSNPEENKPKEGAVKKILKPIASFSSVAGTALSSNPYMATGALIGGNLIGAVTGDDSKINYKFTKVNDADMVVLVRKIDELQKKLLFLYTDYISAKELYKMAQVNLEKRKIMYDEMHKSGSKEEILIADSYYRLAQENLSKAKSKFELSRTILQNLTGKEALLEIEKEDRENITPPPFENNASINGLENDEPAVNDEAEDTYFVDEFKDDLLQDNSESKDEKNNKKEERKKEKTVKNKKTNSDFLIQNNKENIKPDKTKSEKTKKDKSKTEIPFNWLNPNSKNPADNPSYNKLNDYDKNLPVRQWQELKDSLKKENNTLFSD